MDPAGKVALVTGGASGIGLAICEELLKDKAKGVAFCDSNKRLANQALEGLRQKYGASRVLYVPADVSDNEQLEEVFQEAIKTFGQLDIVVNNAGISDDGDWERVVDVNLKGVIRGTLLAFKYMGKNNLNNSNGGLVVNISSVAALEVCDTIPVYSATKHGIIGITTTYGTPRYFNTSGVRVVAICPNHTNTCIGSKDGQTMQQRYSKEVNCIQPPEFVARGVLQMIREAPNGSLWVSEKEQPIYQVEGPSRPFKRINQEQIS